MEQDPRHPQASAQSRLPHVDRRRRHHHGHGQEDRGHHYSGAGKGLPRVRRHWWMVAQHWRHDLQEFGLGQEVDCRPLGSGSLGARSWRRAKSANPDVQNVVQEVE